MKPLVIIPARGGSKGIPGKNIKVLGGKPLINYTIEAARAVFADDLICVSTDDLEIKACVERTGLKVPFVRPASLATDTAGSYDVLLHALSKYEKKGYVPDTLILLQATSPFRTWKHIQEAISLYDHEIDMLVSVKEAKSNPYFNLFEENESGYLVKSKAMKVGRRQDCPSIWELNGAIYIINVKSLRNSDSFESFTKIVKYIMNDTSSIDIDTKFDWHIAEYLIGCKKPI